jgi:sporulation protein YlmC with PRC-barrel domain
MTTDNNRLRSDFLNTQVITRSAGKRLGVVKEILVDIDRREVVALGLRDNILSVSGIPKYIYLNSVRQSSDVILVEDEDSIEDVDVELYNKLITCEVITETGEPLGKVRDFQFNTDDGRVSSIIIASIGIPQIPEQLISTYELSMDEVVSAGPDRLIVYEGAEDRINQLTVGVLERLGIGRPLWEKDEEEYYRPNVAKPENMLGTGTPLRTPVEAKPRREKELVELEEERWDEDAWEQPRNAPQPQRKAESIRYEEDDEEDNWGESRIETPSVARYEAKYEAKPVRKYEETEGDMWDDDINNEPYNPPIVNIPDKQKEKSPEYEEEAGL